MISNYHPIILLFFSIELKITFRFLKIPTLIATAAQALFDYFMVTEFGVLLNLQILTPLFMK